MKEFDFENRRFYWSRNEANRQICLRDQLIDDLVKKVELYEDIADHEIEMAEVLRKELARVLAEREG